MSSSWKTAACLALALNATGALNAAGTVFAQTSDLQGSLAVSSENLSGSSSLLSTQAKHLNQNQWIRISDEGLIRGSVRTLIGTQVVPQGKVQIALVQEGNAIYETRTDVEGDFMIEKAKPGAYSLVATGENQLAICSLTVLGNRDAPHLPDRVHVRTVNPASPRLSELIRGNTMPTWTAGSAQSTDPIAPIRIFEKSCEVRIDARGGISGTLARANARVDLGGTAVYLVREGQEVARTRASSDGTYRFENVAPGDYGLIASGTEGIAAVGFSAISEDIASVPQKAGSILVRTNQDPATIPAPASACQHLNVELAEPNCYVPAEVIPVQEQLVTEDAACCPTMGGCCGTGFSGGGGGGGGGGMGQGGGLGTWAALGALATVAIVQASDNNDQAPIVSPITP